MESIELLLRAVRRMDAHQKTALLRKREFSASVGKRWHAPAVAAEPEESAYSFSAQ